MNGEIILIESILRELKSEIDTRFSDNYVHGNEKKEIIDWLYEEKIKIDWKHWNRYKTYLQRKHQFLQLIIMTQ